MIKEGIVIKGSFWKEPVKVEKIEEFDNYIRILGSTLYSKDHIDQFLKKDDLNKLEIIETKIDFSSDPQRAFIVIEAERFKNASLFDPLLAMNVSKIDPLPFQIEAVYGYVLKQPHVRFLIADDPGAGKTIMAGLILKELKLRQLAKRILIVVPGHLKDQWRRELKEKFDETFVVLDRNTFNAHYGENPWQVNNQVITSIDFAKQEEILSSLSSVHWDLTIVDESHKMSAYKYGNTIQKTDRYKLGEVLSKTSNHLLFLTATPHKGDPENFRLFLDLLMPGFFATNEMLEESLKNKDNPLFIRRLKEDLRDFEGKPIFTRRFPKTIKFRLSENEKELYNEVSRYVFEQYNKALELDKKRNVAFALVILQRRFASSVYALWKSLERRREKLEKILKGQEELKDIPSFVDYEEFEDFEEKERWKKEEEWESITVARNTYELKQEVETLKNLIEKAKSIIDEEKEVKLKELKKAIEEGFEKIKDMNGNSKILIFTESKDTLEYLVKKITSWGYKVNYIYGGMNLEDRVKAEKVFRDETQIMVATEAAGEGINLQFCHIMINYDIPWNPTRLEQRMGRIHRYGQQKDVYIFNLVAEDTREGMVLAKLFDKLEEIKNKLGSDRVFDVIGDIFEGKNFYQLIIDAVTNAKSMDEILKELDIKPDEEYISKIREVLGESLATKFIDYTRIKDMADKAKEYRLVPEYVEEFFKRAFEMAGGKIKENNGFITIDSIPYEIRKIAESYEFKNRHGLIMKGYPKVTFDKDRAFKNPDAEFISFGHPLLEALLEWVIEKFGNEVKRGSVFKDPSGRLNGYIWFYVGEITDGKGEIAGRKILAIYDDGNTKKEINPAILWDLVPCSNITINEMFFNEKEALDFVLDAVERYKEEIAVERKRQAEIKRKYGIKSLDYLIRKLDEELVELYEREAGGEKVDLPIRNKEEQKKRYESARKELEKEIQQEQSLIINTPELFTVIRVIPEETSMFESEEIEKIGMEMAMEYERMQARVPEDVSSENLGFDIRSKGKDEIRYIEVKARAGEEEVALTPNEWFKAKRFKDQYYLYIVTNATTNPTLHIIRNPAENLNIIEKFEVVRFIVPLQEWKSKKIEEWKK